MAAAVTNASTIAAANITLGSALSITGNLNLVLDGSVPAPQLRIPRHVYLRTGISGSNGTASITGSFAFGQGSVIAPGNATVTSNLSFANDQTLSNCAIANIKLGPSSNDIISTAGNLTLNGTINLNLSATSTGPVAGSTVPLFNFANLIGSTANLSLKRSNDPLRLYARHDAYLHHGHRRRHGTAGNHIRRQRKQHLGPDQHPQLPGCDPCPAEILQLGQRHL